MKHLLLIPLASIVLVLFSGCCRTYPLAGHNKGNLHAPPAITMKVGERFQAIRMGKTPFVMINADMASTDTNIVQVETPDRDTAYLIAIRPGRADVSYYPHYSLGGSFEVTVCPD